MPLTVFHESVGRVTRPREAVATCAIPRSLPARRPVHRRRSAVAHGRLPALRPRWPERPAGVRIPPDRARPAGLAAQVRGAAADRQSVGTGPRRRRSRPNGATAPRGGLGHHRPGLAPSAVTRRPRPPAAAPDSRRPSLPPTPAHGHHGPVRPLAPRSGAALPAPAAPPAASRRHRHRPARPAPSPAVWAELRQCESGDDYAIDTGNGYYGAYQFARGDLARDWAYRGPAQPGSAGGPGPGRAAELQALDGWGPWPGVLGQARPLTPRRGRSAELLGPASRR